MYSAAFSVFLVQSVNRFSQGAIASAIILLQQVMLSEI